MLRRLSSTSASWAPLPLRLALGVAFLGHGAQKVFGSFGGPGFRQFISFPTPFTFMRPAGAWMAAAALSELIGGALVIFGVLRHKGFFAPEGMELAISFLAIALALLISGGGQLSADRIIGGRRR
jgi:putative oxidoreductase